MFVFREGEYKKDVPQRERNKTEIIISKNRRGKTGLANLDFQGKYSRFVDYQQHVSEYCTDDTRVVNIWKKD